MRGILFILGSELWFSLSSFFTKLAWTEGQIPGAQTSFFRFLLGFLTAALVLKGKGTGFRPHRPDLVVLRGLLNSTALVIFALSLQGTLLSKANTLNMTYPFFVFLIAPFVTGKKTGPLGFLLVGLALTGTWMVLRPDWSSGINGYDLLGLLSGIIAAFGVTSLDLARRHDSTFMILFWMMGVGTLVSLGAWLILGPAQTLADQWVTGLLPMAGAAVSGVLGQIFITYGYGFVDARTGSTLSSSRIVFSTLLGMALLGENPGLATLGGMGLIALALTATGWTAGKKV